MKRSFKFAALAIFCCILLTAITLAEKQTANESAGLKPNLPAKLKSEGTWLGILKAPTTELRVVFKICRKPDGALTATIDSPDQGAKDIPVDEVTFEGGNLYLESKRIRAVFEGKINEDGSTIEGRWKQSGYVLPLVVRHVSEAQKTQVVIIGTIHSAHHENHKYTPEILKEIILSLKPDVILNELPLSLVDPNGRPIEEIRSKGGDCPEVWAADTVATKLGIKQIPFDRPDRQENFKKTKYFERQKRANKLANKWVEQVNKNDPNCLDIKIAKLWGYASQAEYQLFMKSPPEVINSDAHDSIIRVKHSLWHDIMPTILHKYPGYETLIEDYHFARDQWDERNRIMADNIIKAVKKYPGKRLVVVTGATHRYTLRDLLKDESCIDLKEYWQIAKSSLEQPHNSNEPNQPDYTKLIEPEKLKEDLDFLFKTIEEVHPNMYAYTRKEEFKPIREQLYKDINRSMTVLEFYKLAAPVVAALKNSHTGVYPPYLDEFKSYYEGGGLVFPVEIGWEGPIAIICKNYSLNLLPLDSQLLMINGRSAQEMFANFAELFAAECRYPYRHKYTNNPNLLRFLLFLEYGEVESWDLKIELNDGKVNSYTINSITATEITGQEEKHNDFGSKFSYQRFPDYKAVLLKIKSFGGELKQFDVFRHDFKRFLNDSFQKIRQQNISNLIIDVRDNEGGTEPPVHMLMEYLTSEPYRLYEKAEIKISAQSSEQIGHLRQQLPDKFEEKKQGDIVAIEFPLRKPPANLLRFSGTIFVLTGSQTWSASTVFASAMKCFNVGTLVGEETPDPPTLYGSSIFSELPNSGLQFAVASKHLVAACGKPDGRGVLPDYEVKQKPQDTANGVDTVMQFTLDLIKKSKAKK